MSRLVASQARVGDARLAFLAGFIDDAGMFPPENLPLDLAVERHGVERVRRPWLVARLLCRASQLDELGGALAAESGWRVGVICDGAVTSDVAAVAAFEGRVGHVVVDDVELRLGDDVEREIDVVAAAMQQVLTPAVRAFLEVPRSSGVVEGAVAAIARARDTGTWPGRAMAAKVRCGGLGPRGDEAAPLEHIENVIVACAARRVPLKATAGLHQAVRHLDPVTGEAVHGFFNVAGATLLLGAGAISADDVSRVLADDDPEAFALTSDAFSWRGHAIDADQVAAGRAMAFTGVGSCSIDEPFEDLQALGVVPVDPR